MTLNDVGVAMIRPTVQPWSQEHTALGSDILSVLKPGLQSKWEQ